MLRIKLGIFPLFISLQVCGQAYNLSADQLSGSEAQILQEWLDESAYTPFSIQQKNYAELEIHPLITHEQAINLAYYISHSGYLIDWYELCNVSGFTQEWIEANQSYFSLDIPQNNSTWKPQHVRAECTIGFRQSAPNSKGSTDGDFMGPPFQDGGRFILQAQPYTLSIRWQRDAGEPWRKFQNGLWDHNSWSLTWKPTSKFTLGIGDYRTGFGMGALTGMFFGGRVIRNTSQIIPRVGSTRMSASSSEFGLYRGLVTSFSLGKVHHTASVGWTDIDASWNSDSIQTIYTNGYHRTTSEAASANTLRAWRADWSGSFSFQNYRTSICINRIQYSAQYRRKSSFGGISLFQEALFRGTLISGEVAFNLKGKVSTILAAVMPIGDDNIGIQIRQNQRGFEPDIKPATSYSSLLKSTLVQLGWNHRIKKGEIHFTLFQAFKEEEARSGNSESGWNITLNKQMRFWEFHTRISSRDSRYYCTNYLVKTHGRSTFKLGGLIHYTKGVKPSSAASLEWQHRSIQHQFTVRIRSHETSESGLGLWMYQPSTSLQMGILSLTGKGEGLDVKWTWNISSHHRLQATVTIDNRRDLKTRGVGMDQTKGPVRLVLSVEYRLRLGKF